MVDEFPIVKDVVEQPTVVVAVLKKVSPETEVRSVLWGSTCLHMRIKWKVKPQRVFFVSQPGFI